MELKVYLQILLKKWWIVVPTFLVTLTTGIVLTYTATPKYSATTTYLVVPSSSFGDVKSFAGGLDILARREQIATTFAEIAASRNIRKQAVESLADKKAPGTSVSSRLREGTNIIEITTKGPDPVITRDMANAVGATLEEYVQGMFEVFRLSLLDEAKLPNNPVSPKKTLNLILASILGLVLGGGLAYLSEYLETPLDSDVSINIIDDKVGTYNKDYFLQRLSAEMVRAKRNRYPLSLALMRINNLNLLKGVNSATVRTNILRRVAMLSNEYLREEDIVAYLEDDTFAVLLPDMTGENAEAIMEYLQTRITLTPFELTNESKVYLKGIIGIASYGHNGASCDELVAKANQALQLAGVSHDGKTYLISELNSPDEDHAS